ncbi:MAG: RsmB/NOP family class I SAM-dependent RNA methyltransferase [Deltaproteobacteria bacterium]|nr:RsmB/NOP family class I SAM-dependent RNA methyltransferase [Deltaproteobacteria bacterium]
MGPLFDIYREIIPDFPSFLESLHAPLPTHLRVNRIKIPPSDLIRILKEKGIELKRSLRSDEDLLLAPSLDSPGNLMEYSLGYYHPQALTSCLASLLLGVKPGSLVLDLCASPGGKTSHLARLMHNTGLIVANELYIRRHIPLSHTLGRLGVLNTVITAYPAQEFPLRQRFDFILADVPCSGEGRFRWSKGSSRYEEKKARSRLYALQKRAILRAFDLLKEHAVMVYATCTYNPDENEAVVDFLLSRRDAEVLPFDFGLRSEPGLAAWEGKVYDRGVQRAMRFYPHRVDSVGFFMARVGKR